MLHFTLHCAFSRQSFVQTPPVQFPVQSVLSLQSKLQLALVQTMLHLAVSSHCTPQLPPVQTMLHVEFLSQLSEHVLPASQTKSHVSASVHVQMPLHFCRPLASGVAVPDDEPPLSVVVPLDPPLLPPELPPELDELLGVPLPIVQSYEHAPTTKPAIAMAMTTTRRTLEV